MCYDLPLVVRSSRSAYRRLSDLTCKHAYAHIQFGTVCRQTTNSGDGRTFFVDSGIELDEDCAERPAMYAAVLRLRLPRRSWRARTRRPVDRRRNRKCTCARIRNQNKRNANVPDHLCLRRSFAGLICQVGPSRGGCSPDATQCTAATAGLPRKKLRPRSKAQLMNGQIFVLYSSTQL